MLKGIKEFRSNLQSNHVCKQRLLSSEKANMISFLLSHLITYPPPLTVCLKVNILHFFLCSFTFGFYIFFHKKKKKHWHTNCERVGRLCCCSVWDCTTCILCLPATIYLYIYIVFKETLFSRICNRITGENKFVMQKKQKNVLFVRLHSCINIKQRKIEKI